MDISQIKTLPPGTPVDSVVGTSPNPTVSMGFQDPESFAHLQRVARVFNSSTLVPTQFQGEANFGNVVIALNMACRLGADPMAVLQNLYVVHGKPGWSAQFVVACVNTCGRFTPIQYALTGTPGADDRTCIAWATSKAGGERLDGPPVSIAMAKKEGWFGKSGSKWQTLPELMLRYRAATFFGRLYAPDILMGMRVVDEILDVTGGADGSDQLGDVEDEILDATGIKPAIETGPVSTLVPVDDNPMPDDDSPNFKSEPKVDLLEDFICRELGSTFDGMRQAITAIGLAGSFSGLESWPDFAAVPPDARKRLLGAKTGIRRAIKGNGGGK